MFTSNQVKQEEYLKLRAQEEDINRKHQRRLYKKLAQEQGEESSGSNIARLAERVAGKFGDKGGPAVTKWGNEPGATFGAFLKKLLGLAPKGLSKKAQIILKDLNTPEWKKSFNDYLAEFLSNIKQTQPDLSAPQVQAAVDAEAEKVVFGGDNAVKNELIETISNRSRSSSQSSINTIEDSTPKITKKQGRPKKDTNKELNTFIDLLINYDKVSGRPRQKIAKELNNMINRQSNVNPKIAERMKLLRSGLARI